MAYNRLLLFVCIALLSILYTEASETAELERRGSDSWYFSNWNKYKSDTIVGLTSQWNEKWKIPKHRGWLWAWSGYEDSNAAVKDPAKKNSDDYVLRVKYNAHSRNPEGSLTGGLGFLAEPITVSKKAKTVSLQYSVYFPKNFDFVKGGKLPGVFGGNGECTGGDESGSCFTSRLMWRDDGLGEIYAYLPHNKQRSDICDNKVNICNSDYGYSLGRGQFEFKKGAWTTVRQVLTLNQVNKRNGRMVLYVNGVKKVDIKNVVIRTSTTPNTVGIMFHTFFGGSDNTWATPKTQYSYFKNFKFHVN